MFLKLRRHPGSTPRATRGRAARPSDLNATNDKDHMILDPRSTDGLWPVYKGASFDLWDPDTGEYYAWAEPVAHCHGTCRRSGLQQEQHSQFGLLRVAREVACRPQHAAVPRPADLPYRDVSPGSTDSRTVDRALVPPDVVVNHKAPYLLFAGRTAPRTKRSPRRACARSPSTGTPGASSRLHLNLHIAERLPNPSPVAADSPWPSSWSRQLLAVWRPSTTATPTGRRRSACQWRASTTRTEKDDLIAELDAAVALLYGLDEADVRVIFETFHVGWDYEPRLDAVLSTSTAEVAGMKPEFLVNRAGETVADAINGHLELPACEPGQAVRAGHLHRLLQPGGFGLLADELETVAQRAPGAGREPDGPERELRHLDPTSGPAARSSAARLRRRAGGSHSDAGAGP